MPPRGRLLRAGGRPELFVIGGVGMHAPQ
jgi:hypothetical protein